MLPNLKKDFKMHKTRACCGQWLFEGDVVSVWRADRTIVPAAQAAAGGWTGLASCGPHSPMACWVTACVENQHLGFHFLDLGSRNFLVIVVIPDLAATAGQVAQVEVRYAQGFALTRNKIAQLHSTKKWFLFKLKNCSFKIMNTRNQRWTWIFKLVPDQSHTLNLNSQRASCAPIRL